jgi:CheY-like chemotaxis protein
VRRRVFEPFFTTKKQGIGTGTGIGLSFSQGIVSAHDGTIAIEPSRRGAHFRIALPAAVAVAADEGEADEGDEQAQPLPAAARRRALIVEDEPDVAATLCELVEREGFDVVLAQDGGQALDAVGEGEFDLIFSDVRMPVLNGPQLLERLRQTRPALVENMAFVTGDTIGDAMADFLRTCGRPVLEKPFTKSAVRAALAALAATESAG